MRQVLQNLNNGQIELIDVPCPRNLVNSVLVETKASLISAGTERSLLKFGAANYLNKARQQPEKVNQGETLQYTIQVGAYKTKGNASQMVNILSGKGYNAHVTPYLDGSVTLFKVHVEKFSNKDQANEFANKLSDKESLPIFITTVNPG